MKVRAIVYANKHKNRGATFIDTAKKTKIK